MAVRSAVFHAGFLHSTLSLLTLIHAPRLCFNTLMSKGKGFFVLIIYGKGQGYHLLWLVLDLCTLWANHCVQRNEICWPSHTSSCEPWVYVGGGEERKGFVTSTTKTTRLGEEMSGSPKENLHANSRRWWDGDQGGKIRCLILPPTQLRKEHSLFKWTKCTGWTCKHWKMSSSLLICLRF